MATLAYDKPKYSIKEPKDLSERVRWLRDYYFQGVRRKWNNEFTAWTTGTPWDFQFNEMTFYIVPETYFYIPTFRASFNQTAKKVNLDKEFWSRSLTERRAWFLREVMVKYLPKEVLPGDLIAGGRFNVQTSMCLTKQEAKEFDQLITGKGGAREAMLWYHNHGFGNDGATSGHLVVNYGEVIKKGWKGIYYDLQQHYDQLSQTEKAGPKGGQLRAMLTAATLPRDLAAEYRKVLLDLAAKEVVLERRNELTQMADNLGRVPWEPPATFWEAVQSLWLSHMLVMSDENYPGPGTSFGRIDQYLYSAWQKSINEGMDREFGKEILKCFWVHCNFAYDAMIRTGNQGITAGYGQLFTLSGLGAAGKDMTNDLSYAMLEVIDEMSPILEPKPNVRLHRNSPEKLLDKVVEMIADSQGAPFLLNFDERSMAGLMLEGRKAGAEKYINENTVYDYAPVGCLENTMSGNDRSGTVDNNLNLLKAVEFALTDGYNMLPFTDPISGKTEKPTRLGVASGDPCSFKTWQEFWQAYCKQTQSIIKRSVELYEMSEKVRAKFFQTPYLSCLVKGCAEKGLDITQGGAELNFVTIEAVTYATTVDSLLAIKYLVFDKKVCSMEELIRALKANWVGYEKLQAIALNKAPKYGRDDEAGDTMGKQVMDQWTEEVWNYKTNSTGRQFRPGMLSWNYWIAYSDILPASPDGRVKGKFLSNAICPSNGADSKGPTANVNSVGKVMGGRVIEGKGDWDNYLNLLPNGASHTITFNPSLLRDPEHREKFKAFLLGYLENGGSALQINILNADMLRDAQRRPEDYRHLLVRVTGYNAYFTTIGKELQDEIIARESHALC
ncbi:MAG: pyruvate formate lyase family protein [Anaerolineaceae bacterium]|nr:pyruvate formate lyase family protein [Anaerolineaceae bacterium]